MSTGLSVLLNVTASLVLNGTPVAPSGGVIRATGGVVSGADTVVKVGLELLDPPRLPAKSLTFVTPTRYRQFSVSGPRGTIVTVRPSGVSVTVAGTGIQYQELRLLDA